MQTYKIGDIITLDEWQRQTIEAIQFLVKQTGAEEIELNGNYVYEEIDDQCSLIVGSIKPEGLMVESPDDNFQVPFLELDPWLLDLILRKLETGDFSYDF
jgi:hypothetical protein